MLPRGLTSLVAAAALLAPAAFSGTVTAHQCPGGELAHPNSIIVHCVSLTPERKLGDVVVPQLVADENSPDLVWVGETEVDVRVVVADEYIQFRFIGATVNGEPDYSSLSTGGGNDAEATFTEADSHCQTPENPRTCYAYVVQPEPSSELGIKVGELWVDRLRVVDYSGDTWLDTPVLRMKV